MFTDSLTLEIIKEILQHYAIADFNWFIPQEEREYHRLNMLTHHSREQYPDALCLINVSENKFSCYQKP
jgi:hypothetical protein